MAVLAVCLGWVGLPLVCPAQDAKSAVTYDAITKPSEERALNFPSAGIVHEVTVKEGDVVKTGQILMAEDDRIDQKALASLQIEAQTSETKIDYQKVELEQKKSVLSRKQQMGSAASPQELDEARLDVALSETRLKLAFEEAKQKKIEAEKQQVKLDLMKLGSTINGIVKKIGINAGEVADPSNANRPAIVVVQNDPLKVEVHLPTMLAKKLKPGQVLRVRYPDSDEWQPAKIIFFDPVADAGSGMRLAHLELPNASQREAGWQVQVQVPEPLAAEAK